MQYVLGCLIYGSALDMPALLSEAAVREEIIAPILRALHYRSGGENDIRYELPLQYPRDFLGRKKPQTDPPIRGKADYVCYAGGRVAWTIEAKPSGAEISTNDIEQAYTYARHPEVRAVYFCLCNGLEFRVYVTDDAAEQPILTIDPRDRRATVRTLRPLLGPPALLHRFAHAAASTLPPIGPGLTSFAQIVRGSIAYERWIPEAPHMNGMTISVTGGAIQRINNSGLHAYWEAQAPHTAVQRILERLGLTRTDAHSTATELSDRVDAPTVFEVKTTTVLPQGEQLWNLQKHETVVVPVPIECYLTARATGVLSGSTFSGAFELHNVYIAKQWPIDKQAPEIPPSFEMTGIGEFEFQLR